VAAGRSGVKEGGEVQDALRYISRGSSFIIASHHRPALPPALAHLSRFAISLFFINPP